MRILFVHEKLGAFAGAEANILATGAELTARGHTVGILHGPSTGKGQEAWLNTFGDRFPLTSGHEPSCGTAACEVFQPDVIYIHKMSNLDTLEDLAASGLPLVRMVHDHDLYCMRSYKYNCFTRKICERALSSFCVFPCGAVIGRDRDGAFPLKWVSYRDKVKELDFNRGFQRMIVATEFMKEELRRNGFMASKIEIHAPVPPDGQTTWRSSFSDRNLIIYAGQIVRGKGVDVLLEALAKITMSFTCLIFGDGAHRAYCEKLSRKLGLADRVSFQGYVPQDQIGVFYRECSVAAVSSVWPEPFGAVGLEAMRYGLPVVAFDAGGIKEWLINGQNGFLVPWMDRASFAARIDDLLRDKELARRMGERGRLLGAEHYEFSNYITGLEDLFARVVEKTTQTIAA